jgi:hypothetical protein
MTDLETILKNYNHNDSQIFTADGKFTKEGYETYCDFCNMLYDVAAITNSFDAEKVENELDKIVAFEN